MVTTVAVVSLVHRRRSRKAATALRGASFGAILTTDRWAADNWVEASRRQLSWSHRKRDFKSFLDCGPEGRRLGEALLSERRGQFRLWRRLRDGTSSPAALQLANQPVGRKLLALL